MASFGDTFPDFDLRFENRNSKEEHDAKLAASLEAHLKIYEAARRTVENEAARELQLQLQYRARQESERIRIQEEKARDEARLRELEERARRIPKVPERVPTPPPVVAVQGTTATTPATTQPQRATTQPTTTQAPSIFQKSAPDTTQPAHVFAQKPSTQTNPFAQSSPQSSNTVPQATKEAVSSNLFAQTPQTSNTSSLTPRPQPQSAQRPATSIDSQQFVLPQQHEFLLEGIDRYVEIHKELKEMRVVIASECERNKPFRMLIGDMRREIRQKLGTINKDKTQNKTSLTRIFEILTKAMTIPSPGVDPSRFMLSKPELSEGASNNGDEMPLVFIWFLNYFSKYAIAQLVNEAGVRPEMADPIGVVIVQVFARANFRWRGESLIDIFMAKIRVACPVVFGIRGNEETEQGRASLGWARVDKKDSPYMSEEQHASRMAGLASGYAAICLRDFSKSSLRNPWHPSYYWQSLASIVATPPNQQSNTQYYVLRALVDGFEATFFKFYGNAARAALRAVLIDFPAEASVNGSSVDAGSGAVGAVKVLVEKLARNGINLRA